jgi:hypothetical protein
MTTTDVYERSPRHQLLGWLSVTVLWLAQLLGTLIWLKIDTRPFFWDMAGHALGTIQMGTRLLASANIPPTYSWARAGHVLGAIQLGKRLLTSANVPAAFGAILHAVDPLTPYPPLVYMVSMPFVGALGFSGDVFILSSGIFLGVLLVSTYGIAARLGGWRVGLWAAFIVSMYPGIFGFSRAYLLDVPLVAMVALANYLLLRASDSESLVGALLAGVAVGASMLIKHVAILFEVGGLGLFLWSLYGRPPVRRWLALGLVALAAGVIAIPWYAVNLRDLLAFWRLNSRLGLAEGDPGWLSLAGWLYYLRVILSTQLLVPLSAFFVLGLVILVLRWKDWGDRRGAVLLAAWFLVPYVASTLLSNKNSRYTLPFLPVAAIVTALGLGCIRSTVLRRAMQAVLVVCAVVEFTGLTVGLHDRLPGILPARVILSPGNPPLALYTEDVDLASAPRREDWQELTILRDAIDLARSDAPANASPMVIILPNVPCFDPSGFALEAVEQQLPVRVSGAPITMDVEEVTRLVLSSDFIVSKDGWLGAEWSLGVAGKLAEDLGQPTTELGALYELVREYPLPDSSQALLYRRRLPKIDGFGHFIPRVAGLGRTDPAL